MKRGLTSETSRKGESSKVLDRHLEKSVGWVVQLVLRRSELVSRIKRHRRMNYKKLKESD
jgi:hypothetical protein